MNGRHDLPSAPLPSRSLSALLLMAALACGGKGGPSPAQGTSEAPSAGTGKVAVSDLDRPVDKLMAAKCEHGILQYTCDECRYQVGVVKASDDLFDPAKGGTLGIALLGDRALGGGKEANGEVRLNEERAVFVGPLAPGVVRAIRVDLGSRVSQGQVLFDVDSAEFRQAKADFLRSSAALDLARASQQRESDLFSRGICPKKDLLEAEAALREAQAVQRAAMGALLSMGISEKELHRLASEGAPTGLMPVCAPFPGVVLERSLSLGALVQPGDRALLLADTSKVWVITTLYESDVPGLLQEQARRPVEAEVRVAAYPERVFKGTVERVGGTLDEATRSAQARVVVENPDGLLRAGMFAKVKLLQTPAAKAAALPKEAVLEDEGRTFVFVHVTGPYYIRRAVTVGPASDGWIPVTGGLKAGDRVVTTGAFLLKSDVLRSKMGAGCAD